MTLSKIAILERDIAKSNYYDKIAHQVSDSINNNKNKYQIQKIENTNNSISVEKRKHTIGRLRLLLLSLIIAFITVLAAFAFYHYRRIRFVQSVINEMQNTEVNKHEPLLEQIETNNLVLHQFVKNMVQFLQTSINASEINSPSIIRRRIQSEINNLAADEEFWTALRSYLDENNHNMISKIAQNPNINNKDLKFIELCCFGFNYIEIAITMGYSPKYVSQKRQDIAQKLDLEIPLMDYLNYLMKQG